MKTIRLFAVLAVVALPALAGSPVNLKDWANSPESMFMTRAERAQWSMIKTDEEAQQFVTKFRASRGPDFPALVADRVAAADKYLTYGKTPGSQTLRGRIIIVLGPPTAFSVTERTTKRSGESTTGGSVQMATGAAGLDEMSKSAARGDMGSNVFRNYDIGYTADKLAYGKPINLTVELDTTKNTERITSKKAENELQDAMEMAAAASVKSK